MRFRGVFSFWKKKPKVHNVTFLKMMLKRQKYIYTYQLRDVRSILCEVDTFTKHTLTNKIFFLITDWSKSTRTNIRL